MNKTGFYIKKLSLISDSNNPAIVTFTKGLNVIYGASDTGKTYIYQCIDYLLGSNHKPKDIPEARNYTKCILEIESYQGDIYSLERELKGSDFIKLRRSRSNDVESLVATNGAKRGESISDFLLNLCNLSNKKIRKNKKGETRNLYFQDLKRYFLVDEENIITQNSPVRTTQFVLQTFEENVFRFLLSGVDDSNIVITLKKDEITNKKGKIELFDELIDNLKIDLSGYEYENVNQQISKLNQNIINFRNEYLVSSQEFRKYDNNKKQLYKNLLQKERALLSVNETLKRSNILKDQYHSDILRLKATLEAGHAFDQQSISNCPLCDSEIAISDNTNITQLINSTDSEIKKINLLINELSESYSILQTERSILVEDISTLKDQYDKIIIKIKNVLNEKLKDISLRIKEVADKKEELSKIKTLYKKINEFSLKRNHIHNILERNKELGKDTKYDKLTKSLLQPILTNISEILSDIGFDSTISVLYSEEEYDFIIGGKYRSNYGKGYRAILYAVFILSVYKYLNTKPYKIGLVMIDSPLNPYKPDEKRDGSIQQNLASNFYKFLTEHTDNGQVILIENTELPKELVHKANYIQYTKENGFIPSNTNIG